MKIVSATGMARLDAEAINQRGIPGEQLMENAGKGIFEHVSEAIRDRNLTPYVGLFAGKGNNGGDAFVVARYLENAGIRTTTVVLTSEDAIKGDARLNYSRLKTGGAEILFAQNSDELNAILPRLADCGIIVDGILGTGIKGEVEGFFAEVIDAINSLDVPVIAIDIPSGINGDEGLASGKCVDAWMTVTLALPKRGLFLGDSLNHVGRLRLVDIGMPQDLIDTAESDVELLARDEIRRLLPKRKRISHKGDYGRLTALCGSRGYTGAAALVTQAAMRSGTGLTYLLIPASLNLAMEAKLTEVITTPIPETPEGTASYAGLDFILRRFKESDVVALGPGLSTNADTARLVKSILRQAEVPIVIDADGLNCINEGPGLLKNYSAPCVVTPHIGEFARLSMLPKDAILSDTWEVARRYAVDHGVVLVLKSAQTVIATPEGKVFVNITGNSGMATAGAGDVLTGMIASFIGQGLDAADAAKLAVYAHGMAGDIAAEAMTQHSLIASDLIDTLPLAIAALEQGE